MTGPLKLLLDRARASLATLGPGQGYLWRRRNAGASRRLIGAAKGAAADQLGLPRELRKKHEAVQVPLSKLPHEA
jgi:hypothetical protein